MPMYFNNTGITGNIPANAAMSAYLRVNINSSGNLALQDNTARGLGWLEMDANAAADIVTLHYFSAPGTAPLAVTGAPVTVGNTLYAAAGGYVSPTGTVVIGTALASTPSNGDIIEVYPHA